MYALDPQWRRRSALRAIPNYTPPLQPVLETLIVTDAVGLEAGRVQIPVADGEISAYRAKPQGSGPFPVLVVLPEIFGVHAHIEDVCRRLAQVGYLAVAPEPFQRQGDVSQLEDIPTIISQVISQVPDAQVMADLDATVAWAGADQGDLNRLGITGFCWGGRIVWLYAAHSPQLKAGVAWYGKLVVPATELQPRHPIDVVSRLQAPILGLYGGADHGIPNDTVEQTQAALQAAGQPSQIHLYPDTPHAFLADYRPSYRQAEAEDGWQRMLEWLRHHGVA